MKKLEELGISPAPWKVKYDEYPAEYGGGRIVKGIVSRDGDVRIDLNMGIADASLLAAAPKMYAALWFQCFGETGVSNCRNCKGAELGNCYKCKLGSARSALVDASEKGAK